MRGVALDVAVDGDGCRFPESSARMSGVPCTPLMPRGLGPDCGALNRVCTVWPLVYAPRMPPDLFADLARTTSQFAVSLRDLLDRGKRPAVGSPAAADAVKDELGGDWGQFPAQGAFGGLVLAAHAVFTVAPKVTLRNRDRFPMANSLSVCFLAC